MSAIYSNSPSLLQSNSANDTCSNHSLHIHSSLHNSATTVSSLTNDDILPTHADAIALKKKWVQYSQSEVCTLKQNFQPNPLFLSLFQLSQQWEIIPLDILFHSILIFNSKQEWIFQCQNQTQLSCSRNNESNTANHNSGTKERKKCKAEKLCEFIRMHSDEAKLACFQTLLLFKESQNRVLYLDPISDDDDESDTNQSMAIYSNWIRISQFLSSIYDPITQKNYNPIQFNSNWWNRKYVNAMTNSSEPNALDCYSQLEHCSFAYDIIYELQHSTFDFKPAMEILHQSNYTLIPMCNYNATQWRVKALSIVGFESYFAAANEGDDNCDDCLDLSIIAELQSMKVTIDVCDADGFVYLE